ncbi:glycosyl hydrolase family 95 catalytic domain-containing protein [Brachybacterium sp. AOP43-C2-M15]|uniref:glycosyl hydrolase family 95 catalytic domain-containing protein n=1 Tax=Brachybacterium sp. AOP43-C2-M15 TaxID=3457661 RepID=UPI0040340103
MTPGRGAAAEHTALRRLGPASRWLEALPLGNGRLGAMVWGDPQQARFSLNDSTLWSGMPGLHQHRGADEATAAAAIARSRALFTQGEAAAAEQELAVLGTTWSQAFQPIGELTARLPLQAAARSDSPSERTLDLVRGEHSVDTSEGRHLTLVSAADDVLVHTFPVGPEDGVEVDLAGPLVEEHRRTADGALDLLLRAPSDVAPAHAPGNPGVHWGEAAMRAAVVVRWSLSQGRGLLVCAVTTTWRGLGVRPDLPAHEALADAARRAESALARGAGELLRRHRAHPLPGTTSTALTLTGGSRQDLLGQLFALGRHLLASASRPGLPPANLQGLWNQKVQAPWSSNFTTNINLEMNHWAAGVAQVPDAARALEEFVGLLRRNGQDTARRLYGAGGWALHHNTDAWGYTDPVDGDARWAAWPLGGLWLEHELDDLTRFTGERAVEVARRRHGARCEAARFALDMLIEDAQGGLATFPSTSPENRWLDPTGQRVALTEGAGMDRWLVRDTLRRVIDSSRLLGGEDDPLVEEAGEALERLPGPRIGPDGRILEWHAAVPEEETAHRHVSHLAFVYPGTDPLDDELAAAVERSLEGRGDEATGWSLAWKACLWARLRRPDRVQSLLELFLRDAEDPAAPGTERAGLYPNLFAAHPPFQMDANFGIVAAIAECLLQSHRNEIELLPAVPPLLQEGRVLGLRARPGVDVDITWQDAAPEALLLRAAGPEGVGTHRVRWREKTIEVEVPAEGHAVVDVAALTSLS